MTTRPRLLFLVTEDWYFWSHRLDLARAARDAGFQVSIATRITDHGERIRREGFRLLPVCWARRSRNPLRELGALLQILWLYYRVRPHIVHHVALKPILYGSLAAWLTGLPVVVNAFAGLGYAFTDGDRRRPLLRSVIAAALRAAMRPGRSVALFQHTEDRDQLVQEGIVAAGRTRVIAGSGIDTTAFAPRPVPAGTPIVLLASRMLWVKGIGDFVAAARRLRASGVPARFVLVGRSDVANPAAIPEAQLLSWANDGVEWWEHRDDMPAVLGAASIVVLPTYYREGLPKVLLEAAACARPVIATDVPGCRDIVRHGVNGCLVPGRDVPALADAIAALVRDPALRETLGQRGREMVLKEFSLDVIVGQTLAFYRELLDGPVSALPAEERA